MRCSLKIRKENNVSKKPGASQNVLLVPLLVLVAFGTLYFLGALDDFMEIVRAVWQVITAAF